MSSLPTTSDAAASAPPITRARTASHWAMLPEAGMSVGLWFLYACHRVFGRGLYRALLWPVSWYFIVVRPVARRASIEYLQRVGVLPASGGTWMAWRAAARHVRAFGDALLDKALVWTRGLDVRDTRIQVDPRFDADVDANRGGVMVVAHFGNLEVLRAIGENAKHLRLHILVHTKHAERFNRMLERMNPHAAERLLQVTELDTGTIAYLAGRVEAGDFVVIAADRVPVLQRADGTTSIQRTLDIPFLGANAPMPIGPWVLAAALACPVYWLTCYQPLDAFGRRQNRFTLVCEQMHERLRLPRPTREAALREVMHDYAMRLERACRESPYSWFNFFSYWSQR